MKQLVILVHKEVVLHQAIPIRGQTASREFKPHIGRHTLDNDGNEEIITRKQHTHTSKCSQCYVNKESSRHSECSS